MRSPNIGIGCSRTADLVATGLIGVAPDVVADGRAATAAGAGIVVGNDLVAGDDAVPATVDREVEKRGTALDLTVGSRQEVLAAFVEQQQHQPGWDVVTLGPTTRHRSIHLLHPVHLEGAFGREIEGLCDVLPVIVRKGRALQATADVDRVLGVEVLAAEAEFADELSEG